ncbi:MAG: diguanylate cyclase (GGDEF)-like protein [Candidatus Poriferisodalaceae bacterium]|jgi:diguanylate cyclase (GGDEF)-like protein
MATAANADGRSRQLASPYAVLFMDLNGFKQVNDTYGHDVGDELLITVASRVPGTLRGADRVGRLGGCPQP